MSNELTVINNQGGLGIDTSSPLFKLKPATLNIVQPNSQIGTKGHFRLNETGQEFATMQVTLLQTPSISRRYYIGQAGQLNRVPENLMCYSYDLNAPHKDAKLPQAMTCASCSKNMDIHANWAKWSETKAAADRPPCEAEYYVILMDTVFKMPIRQFIRSKAKGPFETAMEEIARKLYTRQMQGLVPNIFDVTFTMGTKEIVTGKFKSYIPTYYDFKYVTDEERAAFGVVFNKFTESKKVAQLAAQTQETVEVSNTLDSSLTEGEYVQESGDIIV